MAYCPSLRSSQARHGSCLPDRAFLRRACGHLGGHAFNLTPVFTLAHATIPDGPLIFFALATANVLAIILFRDGEQEDRRTLWWLAAGALGGCALLSKYHGIFLFLGTLGFLLTVPAQRRWLWTAGPWLSVAVALAAFAPVIVWNMQHGWAGLAFQLDRVGGMAGYDPGFDLDRDGSAGGSRSTGALRMVGGSLLYLGWLIVPMGVALMRAFRRGPADPSTWFLAALAVGPIAVFGTVSLWANQQFPTGRCPVGCSSSIARRAVGLPGSAPTCLARVTMSVEPLY